MKYSLVIIASTVLLTSCRNTDPVKLPKEEYLSKSDLLADYDLFRNIFEQANAGLYKYHSKATIDSLFSSNRDKLTDKITYRGFYTILWTVIDFTGSCHNKLEYPDSLDKKIMAQPVFFPLPVFWMQNKLIVSAAMDGIPLGSEITEVNKMTGSEFAKRMAFYTSTDGNNMSGKYASLGTDWSSYYIYLAFGPQSGFTIRYKTPEGTPEEKTLPAVTYKNFILNYKRRYVPEYEKEQDPGYNYQYINDLDAGLLTVTTFSLGGPESEKHKTYAKFLDSVFTGLQKKNVSSLIVDIRQNGGGTDPNDLLLYSYLTNHRFRENKSAFTLFNKIPYPQYFDEQDEIKELEEELTEEHNVLIDGRYYQNEKFNKPWSPARNAFKGNIYLLTSPFVASAGSLFASMVKSDTGTVVIGQETLGGYYGHTGHTPVSYRLPKTNLLLTFSVVNLEQDVNELPDEGPADGVKPDLGLQLIIDQYLSGYDLMLETAKRMIVDKKARAKTP